MEKPDELFFDKMRRLERENMEFCRLIGQRDEEIKGLRIVLGEIVIACDEGGSLGRIREVALDGLGDQNGGRNVDRDADADRAMPAGVDDQKRDDKRVSDSSRGGGAAEGAA